MSGFSNLLLHTDSYKLTHHGQYPPRTTKILSYLESRGGIFPSTLFFGLQYYLLTYLQGVQVTEGDINAAEKFCKEHFGTPDKLSVFNRKGWERILKEHGGKLPLLIKAVPEGTLVPTRNVLMTIENTDPQCWWLTNYMETLLMKVWYTTTVATSSFFSKHLIQKYLNDTATDTTSDFKLHDFGYRGVSSEETAGLGAMAHLVNFMGTDTIAGILYAQQYYNADGMCAFSVPASEHSTMTSWGKDNEDQAILNMLKAYTEGIVSIVGDSYSIYNFCERLSTGDLKEAVMSRKGTVVVRPDSGNPLEVINRVLNILWNGFGGTYNEKGFKILDLHIRVIQGDGIDFEMINNILRMMKSTGFSTENITFGSGGGLLQKFDRDSLKFAIKASYGERAIPGSIGMTDGTSQDSYQIEGFDIFKQPATQTDKMSKRGRLKLIPHGNYSFSTISSSDHTPEQFDTYVDSLETVFENGEIKREHTFKEVRERANKWLSKVDKQVKN